MTRNQSAVLTAELLDDDVELTLADLCRACRLPADVVLELVEEGVVEPRGRDARRWRFVGSSVRRVSCAVTLRRDLRVNWAGAALALELLDEVQRLRAELARRDRP